jgi:hypothetical protein
MMSRGGETEEKVSHNKRAYIARDLSIAAVACALLIYEVVVGGGRPAVLTACTSLLLSPIVMRIDEARRNGGSGGSA